ncbi:MAG: N-acetylneuraminate lyase [Verrucomicrobia bacterium]|nr:N-acetylneuraminate lyase [Verrucomicrobiota bacterium]
MKPIHSLTGLVAATHTPFKSDGSLNLAVVETQAARLLADGVSTAFINGTTAECLSLSLEERRTLAQRWFEVARGTDLKISVHVGSNCLPDARALATQAEQLGAISISAFAPSYFKPRDLDALIAWCADIAAAAPGTPFYFYDIPVFTHVSLSMPDFLERAPALIPTLAGLKFTNPDLMAFQLCLAAGGGRFDVAYGCDEWLLAALALGAKGAVGSTYNFAAPLYRRMWTAFTAGDLETARQEQYRSVQLIHLMAGKGFMGAAKATMALLGVDVGPARLPNASLTAAQTKTLRDELETLGFFDWIRL